MSFDPADPIGSVFADVVGQSCWNVRPGYGSTFMMEFGAPHLEVREPTESRSKSEKVRKLHARRRVWIKGDGSLFIEFCGWRLLQNGVPIIGSDAFSDTEPTTIKALAEALDGQKLTGAHADGIAGTSRLQFDLGSVIETFPWAEMPLGMWMFFTPSRWALSYRTDGRYGWSPSDAIGEPEWLPLPR